MECKPRYIKDSLKPLKDCYAFQAEDGNWLYYKATIREIPEGAKYVRLLKSPPVFLDRGFIVINGNVYNVSERDILHRRVNIQERNLVNIPKPKRSRSKVSDSK